MGMGKKLKGKEKKGPECMRVCVHVCVCMHDCILLFSVCVSTDHLDIFLDRHCLQPSFFFFSFFKFETRENAARSAAILSLVVCVSDVMNKTPLCGMSLYYILSQSFSPLH